MLFGHTCKVKSTKAQHIPAAIYQHFQGVVSCDEFLYALDSARKQLSEQTQMSEKQQYQDTFELAMSRNLFGLLSICVFVNHVACRFILDTGAQISGIKQEKAKLLQLPKAKGSLCIGSIGGQQKMMQGVSVDTLQFGAIAYRNHTMVTLHEHDFSLRFGNIDLLGFDGILGWDILSQLDFEMDDIKKRFIVLKNHLKIEHPNMLPGGFPCFIVAYPGGEYGLFGFDSGSKVSWIGEDSISQRNYQASQEISSFGFGVHGVEKMKLKVVEHSTLLLDKAQIDLYQSMTGRCHLFPSFTFDGVFGNEIFKGRRIRLINSKGMVLIA